MEITEQNENCHNETAVAKLRNMLSPHYGLPEVVLAMDSLTDNDQKKELFKILVEQCKQSQKNKKRIDELLNEIEDMPCDAEITKQALNIYGYGEDELNIEKHKSYIQGAIDMRDKKIKRL